MTHLILLFFIVQCVFVGCEICTGYSQRVCGPTLPKGAVPQGWDECVGDRLDSQHSVFVSIGDFGDDGNCEARVALLVHQLANLTNEPRLPILATGTLHGTIVVRNVYNVYSCVVFLLFLRTQRLFCCLFRRVSAFADAGDVNYWSGACATFPNNVGKYYGDWFDAGTCDEPETGRRRHSHHHNVNKVHPSLMRSLRERNVASTCATTNKFWPCVGNHDFRPYAFLKNKTEMPVSREESRLLFEIHTIT